jgi:predicted nucleic acid-binding protein
VSLRPRARRLEPETWIEDDDTPPVRPNSVHKQVKIADLLVAAAAESAGVEVLHYDADFEVIAVVTGQPIRWLAPRGSLR